MLMMLYCLQRCLHKLESYNERWCLDINIDKTKTITSNKNYYLYFYFNGEQVDNVKTYKYLGVFFASLGSFSQSRADFYKRGLKAFVKLECILEIFPQIRM